MERNEFRSTVLADGMNSVLRVSGGGEDGSLYGGFYEADFVGVVAQGLGPFGCRVGDFGRKLFIGRLAIQESGGFGDSPRSGSDVAEDDFRFAGCAFGGQGDGCGDQGPLEALALA